MKLENETRLNRMAADATIFYCACIDCAVGMCFDANGSPALGYDACTCIQKCEKGFKHPYNDNGFQMSHYVCKKRTLKKSPELCESE
jgi:hypothetical protein